MGGIIRVTPPAVDPTRIRANSDRWRSMAVGCGWVDVVMMVGGEKESGGPNSKISTTVRHAILVGWHPWQLPGRGPISLSRRASGMGGTALSR